MKTTFPVMSRYKTAEIFFEYPKGQTGTMYVGCPYCPSEREVDEPGLHDCLECGKSFEAVLPEVE